MSLPHPVLYELFERLPRQGPGHNDATARAWSLLADVPPRPTVLDVGCGSGAQTLELARLSGGTVMALDLHFPLLATLRRHAAAPQFNGQVRLVQGSMVAMPFKPHTFDIIWSEGAIYNIGLATGLTTWQPLLKPPGYTVASELTWLHPAPPEKLRQYWSAAGADVHTIDENVQRIEQAGYWCVATFPLSSQGWWDNFYVPMEREIQRLRQHYRNDPAAVDALEGEYREIELYQEYSAYYGYVFYIMQPVG
jgi:ubiquinone/menaquinone biosynthesis C-methylase UbiE